MVLFCGHQVENILKFKRERSLYNSICQYLQFSADFCVNINVSTPQNGLIRSARSSRLSTPSNYLDLACCPCSTLAHLTWTLTCTSYYPAVLLGGRLFLLLSKVKTLFHFSLFSPSCSRAIG